MGEPDPPVVFVGGLSTGFRVPPLGITGDRDGEGAMSDDSTQVVQTGGSDSGDSAKDRGVDGERLPVSDAFCCRVCESESHPPVFTVAGVSSPFLLCL